jgi:serine racemase
LRIGTRSSTISLTPRCTFRAGCAAAAAARAVPCAVIVPHTTPVSKIDNMKRYGSEVILCEPTQRSRSETSAVVAADRGAALVHPYNDPAVIAGQGTIGLELLEQVPNLDAVLVPTSGGGLVTGIATAVKAMRPNCRIIACEPLGKRLQDSLAAGTRIIDASTADAAIKTIADAIRTQPLGETPWLIAQRLLDATVISVNDDQIHAAMTISLLEMKQVVEPAGAVALAALLSPAFALVRDEGVIDDDGNRRPLRNVAAIICGGNIDPQHLKLLLHAQ